MRLSRIVLALVVISLIGVAFLKPPLLTTRAQTGQDAAAPCCAQPDTTSPREIDFPYYSLRDGFNSTLLLVNASPKPTDLFIAIHGLSGQTILAPVLTIQAQEKLSLDVATLLRQLSSDAAGDFAEGSVSVYFEGTIMPIVGQLTMANPLRNMSFETEMVDNSPGLFLLPKQLNGLWWGVGGGREARITVSNTAGDSTAADVFLDFQGQRHASAPLLFAPHQTRVLSITQLLGDLNVSPAAAPEGGITVVPRGPKPTLVAQGRITDPASGFSTSLNFLDPSLQLASALHASGVPIGTPTKDSPFAKTGTFIPHVIVRNLLGSPQVVTVTIEYAGEQGPAQTVLAPISLVGYETKDLALDSAFGLLPLPLSYCSIRIQYSGPTGSAIAEVSSIEQREDLVIDTRLANEGDSWAGSGANPWHLDAETESILFLTSMADQECRIGFRVDALGTPYFLTDLSLKPHETRAIDLRKLRDAQKADFQGNLIPANATDGSVEWIRLDHLPVMGRLVALQRHRGMASSYQCDTCGGCTTASYTGLSVGPTATTLNPGSTTQLTATAQYTNCSNQNTYATVTGSASWNSTDPAVATVSNTTPKGLVTGVAGGTAFIIATYTGSKYTWQVTYCLTSSVTYSASATCKVCSLTISNPANGQVFSLGGGNYNTTTTPLTASSACSGTANWTLNFSYTSTANVTYTSTASTTSTIGQTNNYVPPAGNGGQINLTAQATLAGHSFSPSSLAYIDGTAIPNTVITNQLVGLYTTGATPRLLTGIAMTESSYRQFGTRSLYLVYGPWPLESPSPALGQYVGMMQVPNGMVNAFDWLTNTQQGASIFQSKLTDATNYVANLRSQYPQLPALSGVELENEALAKYGGFSTDYYTVNSSGDGWVTTTRTDLLNYVSNVRGTIQ